MPRSRPFLLVAALLAAGLAGCAGPAATVDAPAGGGPAVTMSIVGLVQDEALTAVPDATVQVRSFNLTTTTDAAGGFRFDGLAPSAYLVDVAAEGFEGATLTAEPTATGNSSLIFVLVRPASLRPAVEVLRFEGIYQCAFEAVIIPGSCDVLLEETGTGVSPFSDTSTFQLGLNPNWRSIAIDVDFDLSTNPGLEGLRLVVRGLDDADMLNEYQQYGRFGGAEPFTARLDVGGTYDDGAGPVPGNLTALELVVYPQGYGWHATCAAECALGVGAGVDVTFDLYVTVFYNQPAPDGYTLLTA